MSRKTEIRNGSLFVKQTNTSMGMLESGGHADRTYRMPYKGTMEDAKKENAWGISDIDRCIEHGVVVRKGRVIR
ncbi:MAG: hypothetical protein M0Q91_05565 [Methanoregula sp.]|jgi:hypothetical protein|nr:hypothetical protein [Methanoregula sp.]